MKTELLNLIYKASPMQKKKIEAHFLEIPKMEVELESFLNEYKKFMDIENISLPDLANAYKQMLDQFAFTRKEFVTSGQYLTSSQSDAFSDIYDNEEYMTNYMLALALSQFLWKHHYLIYNFYKSSIINLNQESNILEVGSGHGLFLFEMLKGKNSVNNIDIVDISKSSIRMTKNIIKSINENILENINFINIDINKYTSEITYDYIIIAEVIEHVENPLKILKNLYSLLSDDGEIFVTTCVNCPAIDHIYLFENVGQIQDLIEEAGFEIKTELSVPSEDKSEKYIKKFKVDISYAAILKKRSNR